MRTTDLRPFGAVVPDDVIAYLDARGWAADAEQPTWARGNTQVWVNRSTASELLVPLRPDFRDYSSLIADLCDALAAESEVDPVEVVREIAAISFDTIRLRARSPGGTDVLPLGDAVILLRESRALISAVAASTVRSRPTHPRKRPAGVNAYLKRLQMAQTERGSFVLAIRSPVDELAGGRPAQLALGAVMEVAHDEARSADGLSGRATALSLYDAVEAATNGVSLLQQRDFRRFQDVVHAGVSSNLYAALAELCRVGSSTVELSVRWSPRIALDPVDGERRSAALLLSSELSGWYKAAAEHLRSLVDLEPVRILGQVTDLHRDPTAITGHVIVRAAVAGTMQSVRLTLTPSDYQLALDAHDAHRDLACVGMARKQGRFLSIESPSDVRVVED